MSACACAIVYNVSDCSVTGQAAVVRSEKLQMLEQKLYKAQEELMEFHRKKGEVSFCHALLPVNLYCTIAINADTVVLAVASRATSIRNAVVDGERVRSVFSAPSVL